MLSLCHLYVSLYVIASSFQYFAAVFMGSTLFAFQQLSGINAVFYFSSTVFKSFGVPSDVANICVGISNLFGTDLLLLCIFDRYAYNACMYMDLVYSLCNFRIGNCDDIDG